jgi:hypothetical protein
MIGREPIENEGSDVHIKNGRVAGTTGNSKVS